MVADPGGYRWSSYRANGLAQPDARLTPHPLYLGLDTDAASRCLTYRALFRPQLDADARNQRGQSHLTFWKIQRTATAPAWQAS